MFGLGRRSSRNSPRPTSATPTSSSLDLIQFGLVLFLFDFVWFDSVWFRAQIKQEQSKADIGYVVARGGVVSYERGTPMCVR